MRCTQKNNFPFPTIYMFVSYLLLTLIFCLLGKTSTTMKSWWFISQNSRTSLYLKIWLQNPILYVDDNQKRKELKNRQIFLWQYHRTRQKIYTVKSLLSNLIQNVNWEKLLIRITLTCRIVVALLLLIFAIFSKGYSLIRKAMFINFNQLVFASFI